MVRLRRVTPTRLGQVHKGVVQVQAQAQVQVPVPVPVWVLVSALALASALVSALVSVLVLLLVVPLAAAQGLDVACPQDLTFRRRSSSRRAAPRRPLAKHGATCSTLARAWTTTWMPTS